MKYHGALLYRMIHRWRDLLQDRTFAISLAIGLIMLFVSFWVNTLASRYRDSVELLSVGDIILDNIPTIDLTLLYTAGLYASVAVFIAYPLIFRPELAPLTTKTFALFVLVRSFFISLTEIGAPAGFHDLALPFAGGNEFIEFFFINDLFFSGHTGAPFLAALIFWDDKFVRYLLLALSAVMAVTVLFLHVHYSIDVFGAYFITFGIYALSDKLFRRLNFSFRRIMRQVEAREHKLMLILKKMRDSDEQSEHIK